MDWNGVSKAEWERIRRIVALLLSLADMAERSCRRSRVTRFILLLILRPAEAALRDLILDQPSFGFPAPLQPADSRETAMRLALSFRDMAWAVESDPFLVLDADEDEWFEALTYVVRALSDIGCVVQPKAFAARLHRRHGRLADIPDTS